MKTFETVLSPDTCISGMQLGNKACRNRHVSSENLFHAFRFKPTGNKLLLLAEIEKHPVQSRVTNRIFLPGN